MNSNDTNQSQFLSIDYGDFEILTDEEISLAIQHFDSFGGIENESAFRKWLSNFGLVYPDGSYVSSVCDELKYTGGPLNFHQALTILARVKQLITNESSSPQQLISTIYHEASSQGDGMRVSHLVSHCHNLGIDPLVAHQTLFPSLTPDTHISLNQFITLTTEGSLDPTPKRNPELWQRFRRIIMGTKTSMIMSSIGTHTDSLSHHTRSRSNTPSPHMYPNSTDFQLPAVGSPASLATPTPSRSPLGSLRDTSSGQGGVPLSASALASTLAPSHLSTRPLPPSPAHPVVPPPLRPGQLLWRRLRSSIHLTRLLSPAQRFAFLSAIVADPHMDESEKRQILASIPQYIRDSVPEGSLAQRLARVDSHIRKLQKRASRLPRSPALPFLPFSKSRSLSQVAQPTNTGSGTMHMATPRVSPVGESTSHSMDGGTHSPPTAEPPRPCPGTPVRTSRGPQSPTPHTHRLVHSSCVRPPSFLPSLPAPQDRPRPRGLQRPHASPRVPHLHKDPASRDFRLMLSLRAIEKAASSAAPLSGFPNHMPQDPHPGPAGPRRGGQGPQTGPRLHTQTHTPGVSTAPADRALRAMRRFLRTTRRAWLRARAQVTSRNTKRTLQPIPPTASPPPDTPSPTTPRSTSSQSPTPTPTSESHSSPSSPSLSSSSHTHSSYNSAGSSPSPSDYASTSPSSSYTYSSSDD